MSIIHEYRKLKPEPKSCWEWNDSDEINFKIFNIILDEIDFGKHTLSNFHKDAFIKQIAKNIGDYVVFTETIAEVMLEDKEIDSLDEYYKVAGEGIIKKRLEKMMLKCAYCDEYIDYKFHLYHENGKVIRCIELNDTENDTQCFEFKKYSIEINTKTDKFVFMNDVRKFIKTPDRFKEQSINSLGGTLAAVKGYAKDNIITFFVGNTGIEVSQDLNESNTFYLYENGFFEKNDTHNLEYKGHISCGLWWIMGADQADLDMQEIMLNEYNDKPIIIDVLPNSTYILEYDMTEERLQKDEDYEPKYFKFYKK